MPLLRLRSGIGQCRESAAVAAGDRGFDMQPIRIDQRASAVVEVGPQFADAVIAGASHDGTGPLVAIGVEPESVMDGDVVDSRCRRAGGQACRLTQCFQCHHDGKDRGLPVPVLIEERLRRIEPRLCNHV